MNAARDILRTSNNSVANPNLLVVCDIYCTEALVVYKLEISVASL
jgi:hypothetical protein